MGLTDIFAMVKELRCDRVPTNPKDYNEVHADVLACYFGFIRSCDFRITRQLLKERHSHVELERLRIERLATAFDSKLSMTFDKGATTLHLMAERQRKKNTQERCELQHASNKADWEQDLKNSTPGLRKSLRKMLQAWQKTSRLDENARRQLAHKLAAKGWHLCGQHPVPKICVGETDLCIAQLVARESTKGNGPVIVASGDSDYLVLDNIVLLLQNPKRRTEYRIFTQQEVISTLNKNRPHLQRHTKNSQSRDEKYPLLSPVIWKILATVCRNDYSPNIKGYGPKKNWAILGHLSRRKGVDSPKALLAAYVQE
ncbi:hypothetical protein BG004_004440 [Podila humilis]|nr:hypothetical protein BG004_004440 [Podila humilis]